MKYSYTVIQFNNATWLATKIFEWLLKWSFYLISDCVIITVIPRGSTKDPEFAFVECCGSTMNRIHLWNFLPLIGDTCYHLPAVRIGPPKSEKDWWYQLCDYFVNCIKNVYNIICLQFHLNIFWHIDLWKKNKLDPGLTLSISI